MKTTIFTLGLGLTLLWPRLSEAAGQKPADPVLAEATDLGGAVMFGETGAPGMVLAAVRDGNFLVRGFGETKEGNKQEPTGDSLLRINSISKVFTTEVLASVVADGKIQLSDPLQKYAGSTVVPTFEGRPITILDLATYTGSMPREMGDVPPDTDPRTWPTHSDRWMWLPDYKLAWAPGTIASYSNVGFDFLADAIETATGEPYADLLRTKVTAPLGMADTTLVPTPEQCSRLMIGTGLGGAWPCADTRATDGSGGLYSTGNDMARWLLHNIDDPTDALAVTHAVYRQRQALKAAIGFDDGGPMSGLGLGWVMIAGDGVHPTILAKSGGGLGFMSYIAFAPGRGAGVFVTISRVDFSAFGVLTKSANALIDSLVTR
jgi:D-alanyl-D-alanine-carboxypeptidase/D-alanyl-D-alanine-endopeptidase